MNLPAMLPAQPRVILLSIATTVVISIAITAVCAVMALGGRLAFFMVALGLMLLAMAVFRTPVIALMPDITPSPLRSKANGVINLMGGVGALLATFGGAALYGLDKVVPLGAGSIVMAVAAAMVFLAIKEPKEYTTGTEDDERWWDTLREVGAIPREERKSLVLILLAIFAWFVGYNAIETFFTSYGTFRLGMAESTASLLLGFFSLTFIAFSITGGMLADRWGRRRTILTGLTALSALLIVASFLPNLYAIAAILFLGGVAPAFMVVAIGCMWFVTRGEAKT